MSLVRRSLQVVAFLCTLIVGVTSMALIVTQTAWFKDWLRGFIVRQADEFVNGDLAIGRLGGNLFFGLTLDDVAVTMNGKRVVAIDDVGLDYNAFSFFRGDIVLDDIRLSRPVLHLERTSDGWNLAKLIKARTPDPDEPKSRRTIEIGKIGISDGTLYVEPGVGTSGIDIPARVEQLDASVGVKSNEDELTVDIAHVSLRAAEPTFGINALSGVIRRRENDIRFENMSLRTDEGSVHVDGTVGNIEGESRVLDLQMSSDKLALSEIARIVPALRGYLIEPALEVKASGPLDQLAVALQVRDQNLGSVTGNLTVDAIGPARRIAGTASVQHFNVAAVVPDSRVRATTSQGKPRAASRAQLKSDITGVARFDLALPEGRRPLSGTYAVNASHVRIAGYQARNLVANGRLDGDAIRVNAKAAAYGGQATAAGVVRIGSPVALDLRGRVTGVDLRNLPASLNVPPIPTTIATAYTLTGRGSSYSGSFALEESVVAGATLAAGTVGTFAVGAGEPHYSARGQVTGLDLQQVGEGFGITVLASERYRSRVNASFDVTGRGGGRYPLTLDATGTVSDSTIFGATFPHLDFTTNLAAGDARIMVQGQFEQLDPAVVSQNERAAGMLNGSVDVVTTLRHYADGVTIDSIDLAGRLTLGPSTIGSIAIDTAEAEVTYANREGTLARLAVTGADVALTGQGPISLTETGSSNLTLHLETASLDAVGKIVGQPLKGAATVDATVTGNAKELAVKGTLKGSDIGHGEDEALSLSSSFDVTIPELTFADATVKASNMVTFLEVSGQKITELAADVTYARSTLEFDATAQEGMRELEAAGSVIFHPDRQEIVLPKLALRVEDIEWRTPAGAETRVQYSKERVAIERLELVNAEQRIRADGVLGSEREPLRVRAENVDVAQIDRLLLGDQRLAGRLSADATVTGPISEPRVEGQFALTQGAFRTFTFESLSGKVDYLGTDIGLDVRLQQTPTEWLAAKGTAPLTLFKATPGERAGSHQPATPGDSIDLEVTSSEIGLGLIQGFTSDVTNVTGALQANIKVTGSGYDPHLSGAVTIRGGSFAVPELGTKYSGLDTRVDLNAEGLSIQEFKILDARGFPMTVGGTLALHALSVGAVDITVKSDKFEVLDNKLADLKLNTDIHITGEIRKPKVEGFVEVENGTIFVAEVLERFVADPYATEATSLANEPAAGGTEEPGLFDRLDMNLALSIPSNLVLRGNDLQAPNAPMSLGDANITMGGVLHIQKAPSSRVRINGDVNTVRGSWTFQGRRFEIMREGRIGFSGAEEIDPLLDLQARREITGIETFIRVRGTLKAPELTFASNPPLEQADILALIVFNQPINQLDEGENTLITQRIGVMASGYLTSPLARSIGNALSLDEFEIHAQDENSGGPSVVVGEQVGRSLFFRLKQAFGSEQSTELILEYQIRDYLRAQAAVAEGVTAERIQFKRVERFGLDLIFFFSY